MEGILPRHDSTRCDSLGCFLQSSEGFSLALVNDRAAFAEDCVLADVVVTRLAAPDWCRSVATVIDGTDRQLGTHALYWEAETGKIRVNTAIADISRPWRPGYQ